MNIVMSGSGSGGHIYPCISLYKKLKETINIPEMSILPGQLAFFLLLSIF